MIYLKRLPRWIRWFYPKRLFQYITQEKVLYLTFDDGPNANTTIFILDTLAQYQAKATFFCIGKNVEKEPTLFHEMETQGHLIGNHTYHHLNGWQEGAHTYVNDILAADKLLSSNYFRPPYGRMRKKQEKLLLKRRPSIKVVMWNILSGDFDTQITGQQCWENVQKNAGPGDIIVFHDSDKARERMEYTLPKVLEYYSSKGYRFDVLY